MGTSLEDIENSQALIPKVNPLTLTDLAESLQAGFADFAAARADVIFIALIYPLAGIVMITMGISMNLLPLVVPMITGFAILGPVAAVGLYEISRLREAGENPDWIDAFGILKSPAIAAILALGLFLAALFVGWIMTAQAIYAQTLGPAPPDSLAQFVIDTLTTRDGWMMIAFGTALGIGFALAALATSLVSFPLLLDRQVGLPIAIVTSCRVMRTSPFTTILWGGIVGTMLILGSLPMLLGLIVILPVLGHATWHLYRRAVT